jgi:hypothetical protein
MPKRRLEDADIRAEVLNGEWVGRHAEARSRRGKRLPEAAPLDKEQFLRQCCFQGPAQSAQRAGRALSEILPAFQLSINIDVPPAVGANAQDAQRAAVAAVLTCSAVPVREPLLGIVRCFELRDDVRCRPRRGSREGGSREIVTWRASSKAAPRRRRRGGSGGARCTPGRQPCWRGSCS